jgi:hypothetical protein
MPFTVTLIHGTFVRDADWTRERKSKLCANLKREFGDDIRFARFDWDPPNLHSARLEGSTKLLHETKSEGRYFRKQEEPHIAIAHSHGGSVLAYALRQDAALAEQIAGAVFLSTPFIQVRIRPTSRLSTIALAVLCGMLVYFFVSMVGVVLLYLTHSRIDPTGPLIGSQAIGLVLGVAAARAMWPREATALPPGMSDVLNREVAEFDLSELHRRGLEQKTLLIRANADEASAALAWVQITARIVSEIPARATALVSFLWNINSYYSNAWDAMIARASPLGRRLQNLFSLGLMVAVAVTLFASPIANWLDGPDALRARWPLTYLYVSAMQWLLSHFMLVMEMIWIDLFVVVFVLWCFAMTLGVLCTPFIVLFYRVAFGRWLLRAAPFLELSVESAPPGRWQLHQIGPPETVAINPADPANRHETESSPFVLAHAASYDDPRAHDAIAAWLRERLRAIGYVTRSSVQPDGVQGQTLRLGELPQ